MSLGILFYFFNNKKYEIGLNNNKLAELASLGDI